MKNFKKYVPIALLVTSLGLGFNIGCKSETEKEKLEQKVERPFPLHFGEDRLVVTDWDFYKEGEVRKVRYFPKDVITERMIGFFTDSKEEEPYLEVKYVDFNNDSDVDEYTVSLYINSNGETKEGFKYSEFFHEKFRYDFGDTLSDEFQKRVNNEYKQMEKHSKDFFPVYLGKRFLDTFEIEKKEFVNNSCYGRIIRMRSPKKGYHGFKIDNWLEITYKDLFDDSKVDVYTIAIRNESNERKVLTELCSKKFAYYGSEANKRTHTTLKYSIMDDELQEEINQEYEALKKDIKQ